MLDMRKYGAGARGVTFSAYVYGRLNQGMADIGYPNHGCRELFNRLDGYIRSARCAFLCPKINATDDMG
jgi:hypothetical protein